MRLEIIGFKSLTSDGSSPNRKAYRLMRDPSVRLYESNRGKETDTLGLNMLSKVKYNHLHLNSFSRMRVDLAAQVN